MGVDGVTQACVRPRGHLPRYYHRADAAARLRPQGRQRDEQLCGIQLHERRVHADRRADLPVLPLREYPLQISEPRWEVRASNICLCGKVDVRNVALAHILALTTPAASGQRILLISGLISPQLVINTIRKHFPQLHSRVMEGEPAQLLPRGNEPTGWDTSRSTEILGGKGWKYIGLEESVVDTVRSLLALEAGWGV